MEYLSMPARMVAVGMKQQAESCCHKAETNAAEKSASAKGHHCPKPATKECNTGDCCLSCPMCYVTLLKGPAVVLHAAEPPREYAEYISSYGYLYSGSSWKPPNQV